MSLGSDYHRLWAASAISNLGDGVRWTAMPLLAATLTRDPAKVAAIDLAGSLPWFLFALVAGALADRIDRRKAMVAANWFRAALMAALGVAVLTGNGSLWILYVTAFLLGMAETIFDNCAQAILPSLVPKEQLERANGRMYAAEITTNQFGGPPLGGFLFSVKRAVPFLLDAASFALSAGLIGSIKGDFRARAEPSGNGLRSDIAQGLRWLWNHGLLRTLGMFLGLQNMMFTATYATFVLFALEILDLSAGGFGILGAASAGGSVIGSLVASPLSKRMGPGTVLQGTLLFTTLSFVVIPLTDNPFLVGGMMALQGLLSVAWNVITVSMRQAIIPGELLGRVNSVYRLLGWGTMPVGALIGGLVARGFGLRAPYWVAVAVYAALTLLSLLALTNRRIRAAQEGTG